MSRELDPDAAAASDDRDTSLDKDLGDDLLRLMFTSCHPVLAVPARVALTLRLVGGLATAEIAPGVPGAGATIAQRIVQANLTLAKAKVRFEVPRGRHLLDRLPVVLQVMERRGSACSPEQGSNNHGPFTRWISRKGAVGSQDCRAMSRGDA